MAMKKLIVLSLVFFLLFVAPVVGFDGDGFVVSTNDGLELTLDENGFIESLRVDGNEFVAESSPVFWVRDFTVDYEVENLVFNPSFEIDDDEDGVADGWTPHPLQGEMSISLDKSNVHSGSKSVRMFAYSSNKPSQMAYVSSPIEVKGDTEYCLSLFVMNDFGFLEDWWRLSVYVYSTFYDDQGNELAREELQIHHTVDSWKQFSRIIVSPANAEEAEVWLVFNGPKDMTVPGVEESTTWFDDIYFYEMPEKTKMREIKGSLREEQNRWFVYEGSFDGLGFTASYESKGNYIEVDGEIENNGQEKAFDLYFLLPIDAHGWIWWDDIRNTREIKDGLYEMTVNVDESSYLLLSTYPTSAITNENVGLSIAIPLSEPRVFRVFYDTNLDKFGVSFSFGLSPLTKFNKVNFTVYLYRCDEEWGFRSALDRYYKFFPEYFEEHIDSGFMNATGELADFGIRFIQGSFHNENYAKYLPELNENHVYACEYTLPSGFEPKSLESINDPSPNYTGFVGLIDYYIENGYFSLKMKASGAKNSTVQDVNGDIVLGQILRGPNWAPDNWVGRFPLNVDPDLPYFNIADAMMETLVKPAFENAEKFNAILNGVELDNFMKISRYIDMNQTRFQYTDTPLTYSCNNFKPGVHTMATMVEYLRYLSSWLKENQPHAKITGNCVERGVASFGFPYLAALPFEMGSLTDWNFNDIELNYRRSMAYHRFVMAFQCNKMYDNFGRVNVPDVYDFVNESIFYGVYPTLKDDFFENCNYETVRFLYKKIIPVVDELTLAGWEPITYAKTDDKEIFVERFGDNGGIYITVRNNGSVTKHYRLTIEAEKLGVGKDAYVMDMLANINISFEYDENGDIVISDSVKAKETKVFKVSNVSMLNIEITKPRENWFHVFNKPLFPIGNTIVIGRITVETSVYSSEGIDKVEFYIDNKLKFTDKEKPFSWTWNEFVFGGHRVMVKAYDLNGNDACDEMEVVIFNI